MIVISFGVLRMFFPFLLFFTFLSYFAELVSSFLS